MAASAAALVLIVTSALATSAFASANAVVPDPAFSNFSSVQFPGNDDGTWPCGPSGVSAPAPCTGSETGPKAFSLGFNINFYGTEYSGAYVNNNGNITFGNYLSAYTPFGLPETGTVIVAPFFADVDTRVGNIVEIGTGTLGGHRAFVVNWSGVGCYSENDSVTDNFQVILIDRPDLGTGAQGDDFQIEFNYDSIQWDAGQASGGDSNCTNAPNSESAVAGFSNGTTTSGDSYQLPGSQTSGAFLDSNITTGLIHSSMNSDSGTAVPASPVAVPGRYIFNVENGAPIVPGSLPCQPTAATLAQNPTTQRTDVTGGCFQAGEPVDVLLNTEAGAILVDTTTAASDGHLADSFAIPESFSVPVTTADTSATSVTVKLMPAPYTYQLTVIGRHSGAGTSMRVQFDSSGHLTGTSHAAASDVPNCPQPSLLAGPPPPLPGYLHQNSRWIEDHNNNRVKLVSVNWYGAEEADFAPGGLECQSASTIAHEILDHGFNSVRLPWSNAMLEEDPAPCSTSTIDLPCIDPAFVAADQTLSGLHAVGVLQKVVSALAQQGLMVVLDDHTTDAQWAPDGPTSSCPPACTEGNGIWWGGRLWDDLFNPTSTPTPKGVSPDWRERTRIWEGDWVRMVNLFKTQSGVVGVDLRNEPNDDHMDSYGVRQKWSNEGSLTPDNWGLAAINGGAAVLTANRNLLIMVEGLQYSNDLTDVYRYPLQAIGHGNNVAPTPLQGHIVYSPHVYDWEYGNPNSPSQDAQAWGSAWGYILAQGKAYTAPIWVGEWGFCMNTGTCGSSQDTTFLQNFESYLHNADIDWSYWAVNGTHSDAGTSAAGQNWFAQEGYGVLNPTWSSPENATLLGGVQGIQPCYQAPPNKSCSG